MATTFQSTPPHGGRQRTMQFLFGVGTVFQSTPPHGGRPADQIQNTEVTEGFNPRPRTEGDALVAVSSAVEQRVSIHAPARRATFWCQAPGQSLGRFQSTPPHGGRRVPEPRSPQGARGFNPRPRTEGDVEADIVDMSHTVFQSTPPHGGRRDNQFELGINNLAVSIHAPARRATGPGAGREGDRETFQSTPPHGGRHYGGICHG